MTQKSGRMALRRQSHLREVEKLLFKSAVWSGVDQDCKTGAANETLDVEGIYASAVRTSFELRRCRVSARLLSLQL